MTIDKPATVAILGGLVIGGVAMALPMPGNDSRAAIAPPPPRVVMADTSRNPVEVRLVRLLKASQHP